MCFLGGFFTYLIRNLDIIIAIVVIIIIIIIKMIIM